MTISGAILAGGRARRFNRRDKTRLPVGAQTMLERQVAVLRRCVDRLFIVGYGRPVDRALRLQLVPDRMPGCGPLGGLDAALDAAGDGAVLLVACDLPNLTAPFLSALIAALGDADAVVPRTERGYHPVCAVYAQTCRPAVQHRLDQGQLRMVDLLSDLRVRVFEQSDLASFGEPASLLANVNSQADLDALDSLKNH